MIYYVALIFREQMNKFREKNFYNERLPFPTVIDWIPVDFED